MNLYNPLQIASILKMRPRDVMKLIQDANIQPHSFGLRAGLYDLNDIRGAISQQEKTNSS